MDASIVVPSYRSEGTIKICLDNLLNQDTEYSYEVIVVDSSPDDRVESIVKKIDKVKFIKLNQKTYPGIARNLGAQTATGELLIFVDADVVLPRDTLTKTILYYKAGHNVFSGSVSLWYNKKVTVCNKLEYFFEFGDFKPSMTEGVRWCLPSIFLAVKSPVFLKYGFTNMPSSEDVELTVRMKKDNMLLHFNPQIQVYHIFQKGFKDILKKAFHFGITNIAVRKMHQVQGSAVFKMGLLAYVIIPMFAMIKLLKISWRALRYDGWLDKILYIFIFPSIVILVMAWMFGAYHGLGKNERLSATWQ